MERYVRWQETQVTHDTCDKRHGVFIYFTGRAARDRTAALATSLATKVPEYPQAQLYGGRDTLDRKFRDPGPPPPAVSLL